MPKVKTSKTSENEQVVVPTQTNAPSVTVSTQQVDTEKVQKTPKKPRAPKTVATPYSQPIVTTPTTTTTTTTTTMVDDVPHTETSDVEVPVAEHSIEFLAKLQQLSVLISSLKNEYRALEKKRSRELKVAQKQNSKRKRKSGNRAPSGFVKPTRISDELAKFLDKPSGSEMARTEVTRDINKYIRTHNLQDKDNGRKIIPDAKLAALLKLKKNDELTYFNLQRYMSPHFAKVNKDVPTVVA
jgi:upstream activation factor subunit UAF30